MGLFQERGLPTLLRTAERWDVPERSSVDDFYLCEEAEQRGLISWRSRILGCQQIEMGEFVVSERAVKRAEDRVVYGRFEKGDVIVSARLVTEGETVGVFYDLICGEEYSQAAASSGTCELPVVVVYGLDAEQLNDLRIFKSVSAGMRARWVNTAMEFTPWRGQLKLSQLLAPFYHSQKISEYLKPLEAFEISSIESWLDEKLPVWGMDQRRAYEFFFMADRVDIALLDRINPDGVGPVTRTLLDCFARVIPDNYKLQRFIVELVSRDRLTALQGKVAAEFFAGLSPEEWENYRDRDWKKGGVPEVPGEYERLYVQARVALDAEQARIQRLEEMLTASSEALVRDGSRWWRVRDDVSLEPSGVAVLEALEAGLSVEEMIGRLELGDAKRLLGLLVSAYAEKRDADSLRATSSRIRAHRAPRGSDQGD